MLPSVHIEASGFIYSFLISSQLLLTFFEVINVLTASFLVCWGFLWVFLIVCVLVVFVCFFFFFTKWRVPLPLIYCFPDSLCFFTFPFVSPRFPFWPVLPSSLLFFWKGLERMPLSIFVMKTDRKGKEWESVWWLTNYRWYSTYTSQSPGSKFPWLVWGRICNTKKSSFKIHVKYKNEVLSQVWHYKAKTWFCKVLEQSD